MKAKIPNNIKKYKTKALFGLSWLQAAMLGVGLAVGGFFFWLLWGVCHMPMNAAVVIAVILMLPIVASGFLQVSGLNFFQIVAKIINESLYHTNYRPLTMKGVGRDEEK